MKKKIGPLPIWAWGLIFGIGAFYLYERNKSSRALTQPSTALAPYQAGYSGGGGVPGGGGAVGGAHDTTGGDPNVVQPSAGGTPPPAPPPPEPPPPEPPPNTPPNYQPIVMSPAPITVATHLISPTISSVSSPISYPRAPVVTPFGGGDAVTSKIQPVGPPTRFLPQPTINKIVTAPTAAQQGADYAAAVYRASLAQQQVTKTVVAVHHPGAPAPPHTVVKPVVKKVR